MTPNNKHEIVLGDFGPCAYCAEQAAGFCQACHLHVCNKPECRSQHEREWEKSPTLPRKVALPSKVDFDRRRPQRTHIEGIKIEYPDVQPQVRDISAYGAYIEDPHPSTVGSILRIRLWLSEAGHVNARAIVRRVDKTGMAVEFTEISNPDRTRLEDFIRSHS